MRSPASDDNMRILLVVAIAGCVGALTANPNARPWDNRKRMPVRGTPPPRLRHAVAEATEPFRPEPLSLQPGRAKDLLDFLSDLRTTDATYETIIRSAGPSCESNASMPPESHGNRSHRNPFRVVAGAPATSRATGPWWTAALRSCVACEIRIFSGNSMNLPPLNIYNKNLKKKHQK